MSDYTVRALAPDTWDSFAALAERHNGVWNGCWCTWFHPADTGDDSNRARKQRLVAEGRAHAALVFDGDTRLPDHLLRGPAVPAPGYGGRRAAGRPEPDRRGPRPKGQSHCVMSRTVPARILD